MWQAVQWSVMYRLSKVAADPQCLSAQSCCILQNNASSRGRCQLLKEIMQSLLASTLVPSCHKSGQTLLQSGKIQCAEAYATLLLPTIVVLLLEVVWRKHCFASSSSIVY
jgi:hypothetical protein